VRTSLRQSLRLGFPAVATYWAQRWDPSQKPVSIHPRRSAFPLHIRPQDSDLDVLAQVFIEEHYKTVPLPDPRGLILDCGANIGCAAAYFLTRFPEASLVAVEPDRENFGLLAKNLAPYGPRAKAVHAAVWPTDSPVRFREERYDDGRSWARQVEDVRSRDDEKVQGLTIDSLLADSGFGSISLLKMDIEGAEVPVLNSPRRQWLERVDCLAIELHDDTHFGDATAAFNAAIHHLTPTIHRRGEIVVAQFCRPAAS